MSNPASGASTPNPASSRFISKTAQPSTLEDVLKTQTVGLVHLDEFKKRRAELIEQKEREAAAGVTGIGGVGEGTGKGEGGAGTGVKKKKRKVGKKIGGLSFGDDDEEEGSGMDVVVKAKKPKTKSSAVEEAAGSDTADSEKKAKTSASRNGSEEPSSDSGPVIKKRPNPNLAHPPPKALTKATLQKEAKEREQLRLEFLQVQEKIKGAEIVIPFVFYDGTNVLPKDGGVKVKKGEAVWLFLERARRVSGRREWMRVSVDDLLLVRGELIIPHHYEFYYFIMNRSEGPHGLLFDYSTDPPSGDNPEPEVGKEDPALTKVVDRRWYERNKHIFPASIWTEFEPGVDYRGRVRKDREGNKFFFS